MVLAVIIVGLACCFVTVLYAALVVASRYDDMMEDLHEAERNRSTDESEGGDG